MQLLMTALASIAIGQEARFSVTVPPGATLVIEVRIGPESPGGSPPPPVPIPDDLGGFVRGKVKATGWTGPDLAYQAARVASVYEAHAAAAGSYPGPTAMLDAIERDLSAVFGPETFKAWRDAVLIPVRGRVAGIATTAELGRAFAQAAKALREAK